MATTQAAAAASLKTAKEIEDRLAMPPPPNPSKNMIILEPEVDALKDALKNAAAQTGLIYKFYATTAKTGVRNTQPPQSLTAALGREVEKYDQICDAIEARLLRAISVLQRDLAKEEKRIEDEQAALNAQKERQIMTPEPMLEDDASSRTLPHTQNSSPLSSSHPGRRPSAISISSLHRPAFPHKLDLSSVSFRMPTEDNAMLQSGLASPVTLAPKSARPVGPNELPAEFMAAFGSSSDSGGRPPDIDLTLPGDIHTPAQVASSSAVGVSAGDTSAKPIELDLDLFGDDPEGTGSAEGDESLFSPSLTSGDDVTSEVKESDFFEHLDDHSLFSTLHSSSSTTERQPSKDATAQPETLAVSSPGTLLANYPSPANQESFDFNAIDLTDLDTTFFSHPPNPDVNFSVDFTMGEANESTKVAGSGTQS